MASIEMKERVASVDAIQDQQFKQNNYYIEENFPSGLCELLLRGGIEMYGNVKVTKDETRVTYTNPNPYKIQLLNDSSVDFVCEISSSYQLKITNERNTPLYFQFQSPENPIVFLTATMCPSEYDRNGTLTKPATMSFPIRDIRNTKVETNIQGVDCGSMFEIQEQGKSTITKYTDYTSFSCTIC